MDNIDELNRLRNQVELLVARIGHLSEQFDKLYIRRDMFDGYKDTSKLVLESATQNITLQLGQLKNDLQRQVDDLGDQINELQDDKKWLTRLVIMFVVVMVLGVVFAYNHVNPVVH